MKDTGTVEQYMDVILGSIEKYPPSPKKSWISVLHIADYFHCVTAAPEKLSTNSYLEKSAIMINLFVTGPVKIMHVDKN